MFERSRQAECDFFHRAANEFFGGAGDVPGQIQFLCEDVGGAAGKKSKRNAVAVLVRRQAVDDFVERAITAAGNDEAAALGGGTLGNFRGMAWASGFLKFGFDAAGGKNVARGIESAAAALATVAGIGIVNQQSVSEICGHRWFRFMPFVRQDIHSI